jgi:pimeloyl-ACP methyl ester carboxylesterase
VSDPTIARTAIFRQEPGMNNNIPRTLNVTSADGTDIAVTVTGQGRPLVVSPGSLESAMFWQLTANVLAPALTTYAVDRRGHGASGDNPSHSIEREQEDIAAVLELAGPDAVLLGHSYGGLVTLGLALSRPPAALILYEPPIPLDGPVGGDAIAAFDGAVAKGDLDEALTIGLRYFVRMPEPVIEGMRQDPVWPVLASMTPTWTREVQAIDQFGHDLDRLSGLDIPVLLITGELSPFWLADVSRRLQRALPSATLVEIPGHAHVAHGTAPEEMAELILAFVADQPLREWSIPAV